MACRLWSPECLAERQGLHAPDRRSLGGTQAPGRLDSGRRDAVVGAHAQAGVLPRQNQLAQALAEVGKVEQTLHLLECYRDEAVRRRIERRLDRHESVNALGRAVFFSQRGVMRDRAFQGQMHRASCLVIVMAAIIAWNTVYLMDAMIALRATEEDIPDDLLPHIAPLSWRHINLLGRYEFQGPSYSLDQRRPLRTEAAGALDALLDDEPEIEAGAW